MTKTLLHQFFKNLVSAPFEVAYWDGDRQVYNGEEAGATIVFHERPATGDLLANPCLYLGEAYMDGVIDFEGDMDVLLKVFAQNRGKMTCGPKEPAGKGTEITGETMNDQDPAENIQHHYDVGNDFYALWLDPTMSYSCAFFREPDDTLETAQKNKIDHALKKLELQPGERLLDIGSGWGWLLFRAAEAYGVKATGITLSEDQYQSTREKIKERGLEGQVEVILGDYLELDQPEWYDKIVSIGMLEHVGEGNLGRYFQKVDDMLKPGGISLLHSIMGPREYAVNGWITRYIFPGGYIPSLRETIHLLPEYDFHLLHAESLRLHYAKTLDHWLENYLAHWDQVVNMHDRRFARMWKLYLQCCAANFRVSGLNVYQLAFSKGLNNALNTTMQHVYC